MRGGQLLEALDIDPHELAPQFNLRRTPATEDQVAHFLRNTQHLSKHGDEVGRRRTSGQAICNCRLFGAHFSFERLSALGASKTRLFIVETGEKKLPQEEQTHNAVRTSK